MNGRIGRAKEMARIKRRMEIQAKAAGVDITDRVAMRRWQAERSAELHERIKRNSGKDAADWT